MKPLTGPELIQTLLDSKKMKNKNYSLTALGRDLKISQPQLSKIISGERKLSPQLALKVGRHLNLDNDKLLKLLLSTIDHE